MEEVIKKLNEIESASNEILAQAAEKKKALDAEMKQKTDQFDQALAAETQQKIAQLQQSLTAEIDASLQKQRTSVTDALDHLQQMYDAKHEEMAQKLLEKITKE